MDKHIEIIFEDADMIVCHKLPGIAVQSASVSERDMESELKKYLHGGSLFVVHRLDKPVEGLVVFAKNKKAAACLSEQARPEGTMKKEYIAASYGKLPSEEGTLTDWLIKDGRTNTSSITKDTVKGKKAVLDYRSLPKDSEDFEKAAKMLGVTEGTECSGLNIYAITLGSGRHHQIRVQFANAGASLLGDVKYGGSQYERLCLCAWKLEFRDVRGQVRKFEL